MSSVRVVLPYGLHFTIGGRALLLVLACLATGLLLWAFVVVLQQGLERGERMRAEQRRVATQPAPKPVRTAALEAAAAKP